MTKEDAIDIIKSECYVFNPLNFDRSTMVNTALDMAIEALEFDLDKHDEEVIKNTVETLWGEPCEDCVSRSAALDACDQSINIFDATDRIKELPSVKPKVKECEDCVSRKWLKKAIHNFYKGLIHTPTEEDIQAYIDVAPSVKPQPKMGRWILYRDHKNMMDYPQCDNCGVIIKLPLPIDNLNYCPNCGRRMVERDGEV